MRLNNYAIVAVVFTALLLAGLGLGQQVSTKPAAFPDQEEIPARAPDNTGLQVEGVATDLEVSHDGADFIRLEALSNSAGWGLTAENQLYRYDGFQWALQGGIADAIIFDIDFVSEAAGWAVGYRPSITNFAVDGVIWRYNGSGWQVEAVPQVRQINHVHMVSATAGWAVSANATLRYTNGAWQVLSLNTTPALSDISSDSAAVLWGIGPSGIYFFDGSQWVHSVTSTEVGFETHLAALAVKSGIGWAVGDEGTILHYNGTIWLAEISNTTNNLHTVVIAPDGSVWAAGDGGTILQRQPNGAWQTAPSGTDQVLWTISMLSNNQGWIGGSNSTLLEYGGGSWQSRSGSIMPPSVTSVNLHGVSMLSDTEGWAVGGNTHDDAGLILRYQSGDWQLFGSPVPYILSGIEMLSSAEGWIVGGDHVTEAAVILRFDGTSWTMVSAAGTTQMLHDVDMLSSSSGWAAGGDDIEENGVILQYSGGAWSAGSIPPGTPALYDVAMVSSNDGWAVGSNNTLLRYNGSLWEQVPLDLPGTARLEAIDMISASDGWIVGSIYSGAIDTGLILKYNGINWEPYFLDGGVTSTANAGNVSSLLYDESGLLTSVSLRDVHMLSSTSGWAVGDDGTVLTYDGSGWKPTIMSNSPDLRAVSPSDSSTGHLVGTNGYIVRAAFSSLPNTTYLPLIVRAPTPTPSPTPTRAPTIIQTLYYHDFSSSSHQWPHYTSSGLVGGDCRSIREGGRYVMQAPSNSRYPCFRFAPADAEHHYAAFETRATRFHGSDKVEYGIYINGRGGGEYYLLTIRPEDDCGWRFVRREDNHDDVKRQGGCEHISRGANTLRLEHFRRGNEDVVAFFINRSFIGEYVDRDGLRAKAPAFTSAPEARPLPMSGLTTLKYWRCGRICPDYDRSHDFSADETCKP